MPREIEDADRDKTAFPSHRSLYPAFSHPIWTSQSTWNLPKDCRHHLITNQIAVFSGICWLHHYIFTNSRWAYRTRSYHIVVLPWAGFMLYLKSGSSLERRSTTQDMSFARVNWNSFLMQQTSNETCNHRKALRCWGQFKAYGMNIDAFFQFHTNLRSHNLELKTDPKQFELLSKEGTNGLATLKRDLIVVHVFPFPDARDI